MKHRIIILFFTLFCSSALMALNTFTFVNSGLQQVASSSSDWGDYDNDGDWDVLLAGYSFGGPSTIIYNNDGFGTFSDIFAGLWGEHHGCVKWGDYDNDGDLDVLITGDGPFTQVLRNDGNGIFTDINANLIGVGDWSSVAWGDYDNDGDLDILLTGSTGAIYISKIYRNDGDDAFADAQVGLPGVAHSYVSWGDYDNDGDLDILMSGDCNLGPISRIYQNNGNGSFSDINAGLIGVEYATAIWGDYDCDGDLDILLTGKYFDGTDHFISKIHRNEGNSTFIDILASLPGVCGSSSTWADIDNDGDLDILLAGNIDMNQTRFAEMYLNSNGSFIGMNANLSGIQGGFTDWADYDGDGDLDLLLTGDFKANLYRNNGNLLNTLPTTPNNLRTSNDGNYITFSWDASSDTQTPSIGLSYVLRVGTTPGGSQIATAMSSASGQRRIAETGYANMNCSWRIKSSVLANQNKYYWSVQAIDRIYAGSQFALESTYENIKILNPNGEDSLTIGTNQVVNWIAEPSVNQVNVLLSGDNGISWTRLNTLPINASLGHYTFLVPSLPSATGLIKVENAANNAVFDSSDGAFTISYALLLELSTISPMNFGITYIGSQSEIQNIWLRNKGIESLFISSYNFKQINSCFDLIGTTLPVELVAGDSVALSVRFTPRAVGTVNDSIFIFNDSVNLPRVAIKLIGRGELIPPQVPGNVELILYNGDAILSWEAVTTTIYNTPLNPDYYIIFQNDNPLSTFHYLGFSNTLSFIHNGVGLHADHMFYRIRAFKNINNREIDKKISLLTPDMTEEEVLHVLCYK